MLDIFRKRRMWRRQGELKSAYDVVIVGGGSHGLAAAYYLQKDHGIRSVAVLEKRYIGSGAAGRNTTILRSNYKTVEGARFCALDLRPKVTPVNALRPGSIGRQPGLVIREDEERYLFLFGWATGEYMWSVVADAGTHLGGGPVGVDALREVATANA